LNDAERVLVFRKSSCVDADFIFTVAFLRNLFYIVNKEQKNLEIFLLDIPRVGCLPVRVRVVS
jgi:hypothetical protein